MFFAATPEYPRGQLNPAGYTGFAQSGAVLIVLVIPICGIGTHNRIPYLRQVEVGTDWRSVATHVREMKGRSASSRRA